MTGALDPLRATAQRLLDKYVRTAYVAVTYVDPDARVFDPAQGTYTAATVAVWQGYAGILSPGAYSAGQLGGEETTVTTYVANLPLDAPPIPIGSTLTVIAAGPNEAITDRELTGARFQVEEEVVSSLAIARRVSMHRIEASARG